MRAYWAVVSARFRTLLQYRAAALAGLGTNLFWGLIRVMIFDAFYRSSTASQPMSYPEVVTYVWLGQVMFGMLPFNLDQDVRTMVRDGTVAYELVRPLDLYALWFSRALAWRTASTVLRAVPMFVIAGLFLGLAPPPSASAFVAWIAAMLCALLLSCAISNLLSISLLWMVSGDGWVILASAVWLFSGIVLPLPLFPDWAQPVLEALPFRGLVDVPSRLYMGHIPPEAALTALSHQIAWIVALVALGHSLLSRGTRRLVVQGG